MKKYSVENYEEIPSGEEGEWLQCDDCYHWCKFLIRILQRRRVFDFSKPFYKQWVCQDCIDRRLKNE